MLTTYVDFVPKLNEEVHMVRGVGIIGSGPGASALHAPTLSRLSSEFAIVHVADGGSGRAVELARRHGARSSMGVDELLADPNVEVVVLCSPPHEHAAQVLAAVAAGKRAILAEKPLATTLADAEAVIAACRDAGVALVVGTNHLFDPAWDRAKHHLVGLGERVQTVSVTVALPPNGALHDLVTESTQLVTTGPGRGIPDFENVEVAASVVRQLVLGLAIHDLPLLRDLVPRVEDVVYARAVAPIGYAIGYRGLSTSVQLSAVMLPDGAEAFWRIRLTTATDIVDVEFPPAFVHDGSATASVRGATGVVTSYPRDIEDGYLREWSVLAALMNGDQAVEYDELLDDMRYALTLADAASAAVRSAA